MIVPAYATAHMSQILIYWTRGENTAFLNRSSKHFRCVPLRFPISIQWEFNLIPTDISPGTVFLRKKSETKKLGQIEDFFLFKSTGVFGYMSLPLCLSVSQSIFTDYFILFAGVLAVLAMGLQGLLWTNPPTKPVITCQFIPSQTSYPHPSYYLHPSPANHPRTKIPECGRKSGGQEEEAVWGWCHAAGTEPCILTQLWTFFSL